MDLRCPKPFRSDPARILVLPQLTPPPLPSNAPPQVDSYSKGTFKGHVDQSWEEMKPGGPEVDMGMTLSSGTGKEDASLYPSLFVPDSFKVNGKDCCITVCAEGPPKLTEAICSIFFDQSDAALSTEVGRFQWRGPAPPSVSVEGVNDLLPALRALSG